MGNEKVEPQEMFTRSQMVTFAGYVLSDRRTKRITDNWDEKDPTTLSDRLKEVYHADIENWEHDMQVLKESIKSGSGE